MRAYHRHLEVNLIDVIQPSRAKKNAEFTFSKIETLKVEGAFSAAAVDLKSNGSHADRWVGSFEPFTSE